MLVCVLELTRKIFVNLISVSMQISLSRMDTKPRNLPSFHVGVTDHLVRSLPWYATRPLTSRNTHTTCIILMSLCICRFLWNYTWEYMVIVQLFTLANVPRHVNASSVIACWIPRGRRFGEAFVTWSSHIHTSPSSRPRWYTVSRSPPPRSVVYCTQCL